MTGPAFSDERFERLVAAVRAARIEAAARGERLGDRRNRRASDTPRTPSLRTAAELADALSARVLHQPGAVDAAARVLAVRLGVARLHPQRPHAFLLATGPTGTGKTTLAMAIAAAVYGDEGRMVRVDCSELAGGASVSSLVGPPPGYVGFDRPDGWLTTRVAKMGRGVVLFDEVEKAHPDIWQTLLQIGEGRLSDATGRTVSFADTTVMLTANIGAAQAARRAIGFGEPRRDAGAVMAAAVTTTFAPELLGRLDATLVFHQLPDGANVDIAWRTWGDYQSRMQDLGWDLELDRSTLQEVVSEVRLDTKGAREVERAIEFDVLAGLNGLGPGRYRAQLASNRIVWTSIDDPDPQPGLTEHDPS